MAESEKVGDLILCGARRLAALGDGIERLEKSQAAMVEVCVFRQDGDPMLHEPTVPLSRVKLLELFYAEREYVGKRLARILGEVYGGK